MVAPAQAALEVPALGRHITDNAQILSGADADALEADLAQYEHETGHQFAVLSLPSLQGEPIEDVAVRTFDRWALGDKKRDDGLLVLVAASEKKVRIEVGDGLEGVVTDALSAQIIREQMAPRFRKGDYAGGLRSALGVLMAAARGEAVAPATPGRRSAARGTGLWLFFIVVWVVVALASRRRRGGLMVLPPFGGGWQGGSRHDDWWSGGSSGGGFAGGGGRSSGGGASGGW